MKFIDIKKYLESIYPPEKSFSWDNDGVEVCCHEEAEVKSILLCLDITPNVVDYAVNNAMQLIISHHPLLYSPIKKLTCTSVEVKTGLKLYKNNISAMSFHTRLDAAINGVNDMFIKASKLYSLTENIKPFGNAENDSIGRIIEFNEEKILTDLAIYIRDNLYESLAVSKFDTNFKLKYIEAGIQVKKAAIVAGSGLMFLDDAIRLGIDTFITGEASYSKLISSAGYNINFILCNHFESEVFVLPMLKSLIEDKFNEIKVTIHTENIIKELR